MALIDDVKEYCRAEDDVQAFIDAAELYLTNAGITANETSALYCLAVKMLVLHWYDNREPVGKTDKIAYGLADVISSLKYNS